MDEIIENEVEESNELSDDKILEVALERYKVAKEAWSDMIQSWHKMARFAYGDQWKPDVKSIRDSQNRTSVVYNKSITAIRYVENSATANPPSIKCYPIKGNTNTAKILDGLIRNIQYESNAKEAYINGLSHAITGGWGCWKVLPKECKDSTFTLAIERIKHPTSVLFDPDSEKSDMSDAQYCFYIRKIPKAQFIKAYPNANTEKFDSGVSDWYDKESAQIAEYWVKNEDGSVNQYLITDSDVLYRNENYPGEDIPFIFIPGKEVEIEGQREFRGMLNDVVDVQRFINYVKSEQIDYIAGSSHARFIIPMSCIRSEEQKKMLEDPGYKGNIIVDTSNGAPIAIDPPRVPEALMASAQDSDADLRAILGIRDPNQDISKYKSGKAVAMDIEQHNVGSYGYLDNLYQAIRRTGNILINLIPFYYSDAQTVNIMGEDSQVTSTKINESYIENGEWTIHDLVNDKYSCVVSVGPSYDSQRSETRDKLVELSQRWPALLQNAGDILVKSFDFPGSEDLASRIRATIPPQILAASSASNGDKTTQLQVQMQQIQQMQMQMQQMQQAMMAAQAENANLQKQLNDRTMEFNLKDKEIKAKYDIAMMNNQAKLEQQDNEATNDSRLLTQKTGHDIITGAHSKSLDIESIGGVGII